MVDCVLLVCACVMLYGWSDLVFVRHWHSILYWFTTPPMSVVTHFTSSVFCFHRSTVCVRVSRAVITYLQKWIVEVQKGTVKYHYWRKTKDCSLLLKWQSEFLLNRIVIHTYTIHWPLINGRWESQFRLEEQTSIDNGAETFWQWNVAIAHECQILSLGLLTGLHLNQLSGAIDVV